MHDPKMTAHAITILTYFAKSHEELTGEQLARSYQKVFPDRREGMNAIEQLRHEGFQQGMQQGLLSMTLRLLRLKIGAVSEQAQEEINTLSPAQLEKLGEALLGFSTPPELESWLQKQQVQH